MKAIIYFFVALITISAALAFDCDGLSNAEMCQQILDSELSEEDKEYLLSDILSENKYEPDHDFVREWNLDVDYVSKETTDSSMIKNAWVKVLAVMPSVLYNNTLYIDSAGEVLTAFDYDVQVPTGRARGDCRTKRYVDWESDTLSIYADSDYLGSDELVNYELLSDSVEFVAQYSVSVRIREDHYTWQQPCRVCSVVCMYDYSTYRSDSLTVEDSLNAVVEDFDTEFELTVLDQYLDTTKIELDYSELANLELVVDETNFTAYNYVYSEFITDGILTVKAELVSESEENEFLFATPENCEVIVSDFFNSETFDCDLSYERPEFSVSVEEIVYDEGDIIYVTIEPASDYLVEYAGSEYEVSDSIELVAEYPYNQITINSGEVVEYQYIHVKDGRSWSLLLTLGMFGSANYLLIALIRKFWGAVA